MVMVPYGDGDGDGFQNISNVLSSIDSKGGYLAALVVISDE